MNNIALITGASSGIGRELARIHASKKRDLIIIARDTEKLEALAQELRTNDGVEVMVITQDLSEEGSAKKIYEAIREKELVVSYLINNAGFGLGGNFHTQDQDKIRSMMMVNMTAVTDLCRLYIPEMIEQGSGKILNVSSTASFSPGPGQALYFATKAYVQFLSNALWQELKDTKVTVTNLMPGATETDFAKEAELQDAKLFENTVSAYSVAEDGYKAMEEGKLDVISGLPFMMKILVKYLLPFVPKKKRLSFIQGFHTKNG